MSELSGCRIAVDGHKWLSTLGTPPGTGIDEPFLAIGSCPLSLRSTIAKSLEKFTQIGIRPFLIFNGLQIKRGEKPRIFTGAADTAKNAWLMYHRGEIDNALGLFRQNQDSGREGTFFTLEMINSAISICKEMGVETFRAPYLAHPQLVRMLHHNLVTHCYGTSSLLLFNCPQMILRMDFSIMEFGLVNFQEVLQRISMECRSPTPIPPQYFWDSCILAGWDQFSPTFQPIHNNQDGTPGKFSLTTVFQTVHKMQGGFPLLQYFAQVGVHPTVDAKVIEQFLRTRVMVRNHLVLDPSGAIVPLCINPCPHDLHEVIGTKLPAEAYFCLAQGIVSPDVLNTVISGYLIEPPPLVDSDQCRNLSANIVNVRSWAIQLLRGCLHSYYQSKPIYQIVWHRDDQGQSVELHPTNPTVLKHWRISQFDIKGKIEMGFLPGISMAIQHLQEQFDLNGAQCFQQDPAAAEQIYTTPEELHCAVLYNVLAQLNHVHPEFSSQPATDGSLQPIQPAVTPLSQCFKLVPAQFDKECFVFVEMLKLGLIHGMPFTQEWEPSSATPWPNHDRVMEIALLSRVFSLLPIQQSGKGWSEGGPHIFDHDLMCFNSCVTKLTRSMRSLFEMQFFSFILQRRTIVDCKIFADISSYLPFKEDVGVAMGIVMKKFLEKAYVEKVPNVILQLPEMFPACENVMEDLSTAFKFWEVIMHIIMHIRSVLPGDNAINGVADMFQKANEFLRQIKANQGCR